MKYEVAGRMNLKGDWRKFVINMDANSEGHLYDKVYAYFGGKYGIKRNSVKIENVKEMGE